jgi:hypothetical protein
LEGGIDGLAQCTSKKGMVIDNHDAMRRHVLLPGAGGLGALATFLRLRGVKPLEEDAE